MILIDMHETSAKLVFRQRQCRGIRMLDPVSEIDSLQNVLFSPIDLYPIVVAPLVVGFTTLGSASLLL